MKYVNVVIETNSENTDNLYTYKSEYDDIRPGHKVTVPFARSKNKEAYVFSVSDEPPENFSDESKLKSIIEIDEDHSLDEKIINICAWMKKRYFCRYIEGINCFAPTGKPLKSGKRREIKWDVPKRSEAPELTEEQSNAVNTISPYIKEEKYSTFLIHGVTGSGKTEVYMQITQEVIAAGRQVIMLVPEISLTPQTIERFMGRFGKERVAVLHSKLSIGERYDQWLSIKKGEVDIVIGARSAVFAPLTDIGAIIIDEEHETSYRSDKTPKYDTVEVAIKRGIQNNAVVVLGSATPSVISNYRAKTGLYKKISLKKRYNHNPLPSTKIIDMRQELVAGNKSIFSSELYDSINKALSEKKQVILFLNRRGYSNFISCRSCGYVMKCEECGISMTYHKKENMAVCHYCGRKTKVPEVCPECKSRYLRHFGIGTEKVEEFAKDLFPEAKITRLDLDTGGTKGSINKILKDFEKGKSDILIGTQMIAKGLDFANVSLVGIMAADISLNIPDYRSAERTFQLITQVSGRSGRGDEVGEVLIQTYMPDNYAVSDASQNDYKGFYNEEISLRKAMTYPPFSDIIRVSIVSKNPDVALSGAKSVIDEINNKIDSYDFILGPQEAPIFKTKEEYRYHVMVKAVINKRKHYETVLSEIKKAINTDRKKKYRMIVEVNPFSMI